MKIITDTGVEIPIESIKVMNVQPGDVVVIHTSVLPTSNIVDAVSPVFEDVVSGVKVIIMGPDESIIKIYVRKFVRSAYAIWICQGREDVCNVRGANTMDAAA